MNWKHWWIDRLADRQTDRQTDGQTDRQQQSNMPFFFRRGHTQKKIKKKENKTNKHCKKGFETETFSFALIS